jgi:predicted transcriptional regulator
MTQTLMEMATVFVVARIRAGPCPPDVIARLLQTIHATLFDLSRQEATQKIKRPQDATPSESLAALRLRPWGTLQHSQVICLECGKSHRLLSSRHLVLHGLTATAYKQKWGIPLGRPLSARSLTQRRRRKARERNAGQYLAAWRAQRRQQTA